MKQIITLLSLSLVFAVQAAEPFRIAREAMPQICVEPGLRPFVTRAAEDLANDLEKIFGVRPKIGSETAQANAIVLSKSGEGWEKYEFRSAPGNILRIVGSDDRGVMFGVYDFCERCLGVDPMYFWSDVAHPKKAVLAWDNVEFVQSSPTFRFRGWFLNDEDLLTMWQNASGIRDYSTYRYYNNVVSHEAMERVAEALVRSRMNMIIPASLLNVTHPAEEGLAAICAKRGVYVTMHHIEPMGLSGFAFKDYWKKRGRDLEYSYFKHPREVEEAWRETARRWAKFPNVIWQIGLRGTGDRPMWSDDPTMPKDDAGRANLISAALARQVEILDEIGVPKEGRILTTTLWAEGAYFNAKGLLKIPAGTIVVFADNNCGWRWQSDLLQGSRMPGVACGVYYHHQLIGMGPHLVSLVPAAKTCEMLRTAREKGAGTYAIFNVGNVREFVYGIDATAKMTWNLDSFDADEWTRAWLARRIPSAWTDWTAALNVYHRSLQLNPPTGVPLFLDGLMQQQYRSSMNALQRLAKNPKKAVPAQEPSRVVHPLASTNDPFRVSLSDTHPRLASPSDTYMRLAAQRAGYEQALLFGERAFAKTAAGERRFAKDFLLYPATVMRGFTHARMEGVLAEEALRAGDAKAAVSHLEAAAEIWQSVIDAGEDYCHGAKWATWYRGCEKVSPRDMKRLTLETISAICEGNTK